MIFEKNAKNFSTKLKNLQEFQKFIKQNKNIKRTSTTATVERSVTTQRYQFAEPSANRQTPKSPTKKLLNSKNLSYSTKINYLLFNFFIPFTGFTAGL